MFLKILLLLHQIGTLLLYGIADTTDSALPQGSNGCARLDVVNIRDTLREGHQRVEGIQVGSALKIVVLKSRFTHFSLMAERMLLSISEWQACSGTTVTVQRLLTRKSLIFCHFLSHYFHVFFSQRYNHNCAKTPDEKIDGVAVNNEDYPRGTAEEKAAFLTNLSKIGSLK